MFPLRKVIPVCLLMLCLLVASAEASFPLLPRRRARLAVDRANARALVAASRHRFASPVIVRNGIFVPHVAPVIQQRVIIPQSQFFLPVPSVQLRIH